MWSTTVVQWFKCKVFIPRGFTDVISSSSSNKWITDHRLLYIFKTCHILNLKKMHGSISLKTELLIWSSSTNAFNHLQSSIIIYNRLHYTCHLHLVMKTRVLQQSTHNQTVWVQASTSWVDLAEVSPTLVALSSFVFESKGPLTVARIKASRRGSTPYLQNILQRAWFEGKKMGNKCCYNIAYRHCRVLFM
jgi:hypothetical protein